MTKVDDYRAALRSVDDWGPYLRANSHLPGPRGNLELITAVGEEGSAARVVELLAADDEFLVACGLVALGRIALEEPEANGDGSPLAVLRAHASDSRWRVREAVAMGLQRLGDADPVRLVAVVTDWAGGNVLEQRASIAAICEPRLLRVPAVADAALETLERVTRALLDEPDRRSEDVRVLRKALGYAWSVAVVASPERGRGLFEHLATCDDPDARWIVRENLGKARLRRMDDAWVDGLVSGSR